MDAEQGNGTMAWKMLVDTYEQGHRADFLESLELWEILTSSYLDQSREEVSGSIKCGVVMKRALAGVKMALNYEKPKKCVKGYLQSGAGFNPRGKVGGVGKGERPKEKAKDGKIKCKDKNKSKTLTKSKNNWSVLQ